MNTFIKTGVSRGLSPSPWGLPETWCVTLGTETTQGQRSRKVYSVTPGLTCHSRLKNVNQSSCLTLVWVLKDGIGSKRGVELHTNNEIIKLCLVYTSIN